MKYAFIINPNSGSNKKKNIIKRILNTYPSAAIEIHTTEYPGHAAEIAQNMCKKDAGTIIAVGGDGTVNEIASQLVGTDSSLGIVPMGSGNGFARSLNLALNPHAAIQTIFKGNIKRIDVGKVNDRFFFAISGVGIDAHIAWRFQQSKRRGPLPYFTAGFKELLKYPYPEFSVRNDDRQTVVRPLLITVANAAQFGNGAQIAPQADLCDGSLDICIVRKMSLLHSVAAAIRMFAGSINKTPAYSAFQSNRVEIASQNHEIKYHIDGEPLVTDKNLVFEIVPKSLNVITH